MIPTGREADTTARVAWAVIGVVSVLAVATLVVRGVSGSDADGAADGRPEGEADPTVVDDDSAEPHELAVGAPDDGTDSLGLPVGVAPSADLVDGQQVEVVAEGFPALTEVALVQCSPHAGPNPGVERCMISTFERSVTDLDGTVTTVFTVQRVLTIGDREIDCAGPPPDGHETSCVVAVSMLSDYDVSGTALLHFDPEAPLAPHPAVSVSATTGLADYQLVTVTLANPGVGSRWFVNECVVRAEPVHCGGGAVVDPVDPDLVDVVSSDDGTDITFTVPTRRMIDAVDCGRAPEACSMVLERQGDGRILSVRLSFDPDLALAPLELALDAPLVADRDVGIEIVHRSLGQVANPILQCPTASAGLDDCVPIGSFHGLVAMGTRGSVRPMAVVGDADCAVDGACVLRTLDGGGSIAAEWPVTVTR